jgi:hypothetical protein
MSSWTSAPLPLNSQVGGHAGVLTTDDGSLIVKEALPLELEFYQTHASNPAFEPLRPFLPKFYGTLKLEGTVDETNTDTLVVKPLAQVSEHHRDECRPAHHTLGLLIFRVPFTVSCARKPGVSLQ